MSSRADERHDDDVPRLADIGAAIASAVEELAVDYLVRRAADVVDAWGLVAGEDRPDLDARILRASVEARNRVTAELRVLLGEPAAAQGATPLEVVRGLPREVTRVLAASGIPAVVRDPFDERAWPDDRYEMVPRSLADLGDSRLAPLHLAWGVAKAKALRERT